MKSKDTPTTEVPEVESVQNEGEAGQTDGRCRASETLEATSLAELTEGSHGGVNDEERRKIYTCKFCGKTFDKHQALGGHMNKHPEDKHIEKVIEYRKLLDKQKFKSVNPREYMPFDNFNHPGDTSNVFNMMQPTNLIQQSYMEPPQTWHSQVSPMDLQQLSQQQDDLNLTRGTFDCFIKSNQPTPNVAFDAVVDGNHGSLFMDPSLYKLTLDQHSSLPVSISMPPNATCEYPHVCSCFHCDPSNSRFYQDPQMILQCLNPPVQEHLSSTLDWNQSGIVMPPKVQMNNLSYDQYAYDSPVKMSTQEMVAPQDFSEVSNSPNTYDYISNDSQIFYEWSDKPTN